MLRSHHLNIQLEGKNTTTDPHIIITEVGDDDPLVIEIVPIAQDIEGHVHEI